MYVFGDDVAWVMRSAAARGEVADLARARNGARALRATDCSILSCSWVERDRDVVTLLSSRRCAVTFFLSSSLIDRETR